MILKITELHQFLSIIKNGKFFIDEEIEQLIPIGFI